MAADGSKKAKADLQKVEEKKPASWLHPSRVLLTALAGLVTGALARLLVSRLMKEER